MKLNKRKGFTIVELVIVIAVIAILAAVLIPNISNLVKKANASADESLVRNLNTALSMDVEKHQTMDAALEAALKNGGYELTTIVTKNKDNKILWDSKNDCFVYMKKGASKPTYLPNTQEVKDVKPYDYFEIVELNADGTVPASDYSAYLAGESTIETVTTSAGLDVGKNKVGEVKFTNNNEVSVLINTNGGKLTVDASKASVTHRGVATIVTINAVATKSYHENGKADHINLAAGRVVVEGKAEVGSVLITATEITGTDEKNVSVEVKDNAILGAVAANNATAAGKLASAVSGTTDVMTEVANSNGFAGGFGTEKAPYLIATGDQFTNINTLDFSANSYFFKQIDNITITKNVDAFAGTYDGGNYKVSYILTSGNFGYLFKELRGYGEFKNIHVEMGQVGVALLSIADWATSFGATFDNLVFSSTVPLSIVNVNNFGFVVINPLYTNGQGTPTYRFTNIVNNVNLQNLGTCVGMIVGSGPCFNVKTTLIYSNCINNGDIVGAERVGFLYGNSAWVESVAETESQISISGCKNYKTLTSMLENNRVNSDFALELSDINEKHRDEVGGAFITSSYFKDNVVVNQNGSDFSINTKDNSVNYQLVFSVGAIYTMKDKQAWEQSDIDAINNKKFDTIAEVSNGIKHLIDLPIKETTGNLTPSFKALDKQSATNKGFDISQYTFENGYEIVVKDGTTYLIFNVAKYVYIDCDVSVRVYAYAAGNLKGIKVIK